MDFTKIRELALGLCSTLAFSMSMQAVAQVDGFDINDLNGSNGFKINGLSENASQRLTVTHSISAIGDINHDGMDDLAFANSITSQNGANTGTVYVLYGRQNGFDAELDVSDINGINGFRISGITGSSTGNFVNAAGDVNDDGINDFVIGSGRGLNAYIVFGRDGNYPESIAASEIDDGFGVIVRSIHPDSGDIAFLASASYAGDLNQDGIDDVAFGSGGTTENLANDAFVVFGRNTAFPSILNLQTLDGNDGFAMDTRSIIAGDAVGGSLAYVGDVNNDGIDDMAVSSVFADTNGGLAGSSFIVFGRDNGFPARLNLGSLDGSNGFILNGSGAVSGFGHSLASIGDINQDGIDDMAIGAFRFRNGARPQAGRVYVVFGRNGAFPAAMNAEAITSNEGFIMSSNVALARMGSAITAAGDFNRDGYDDFAVGLPGPLMSFGTAGRVILIYGRTTPFPDVIDVDAPLGALGVNIVGSANDRLGSGLSLAGDMNGDGLMDLAISSDGATNDRDMARSNDYVLFNNATEVIFAADFEAQD